MSPSIHRILPVLLAAAMALSGVAQDEGLTRDFEKLSAKERARIAKEEQEAATKDVAYQAVMADAEDLFRRQEFEASMAKFKEARAMRPYNVYPKVKIQDLEALIAKRDAQLAIDANKEGPEMVVVPPEDVPLKPEPRPVVQSEAPVHKPLPAPVHVPVTIPEKGPIQKAPVVPAVRSETEVPLEEGERVYKEGRSIVVERHVELDGRIVVFRKVSHPWGAVDHFRDGSPIPARAYDDVMVGR
jgi:hypothetical protein